MRHLVGLTALGVSLALLGCGVSGDPEPSGAPADATGLAPAPDPAPSGSSSSALNEPTGEGEEVLTASGLAYQTIQAGDGPQAKPGDRVVLHYVATIEGGEAIDSSRDRGTPWTHTIGDARAVQGFNEGIAGMKVGELRRLVVPANLAYGALGTFGEYAPGKEHNLDGAMQAEELPSIPPNSTIIYEVELLELASEPADAPEYANTEADAPEPAAEDTTTEALPD
ncbi:FKBP-type peptidyl-prolyl cis-trans isomerase [Tautonia marina]|uniref:FKBP-type peptidyl-prolyl cis-trans isomerase n=1 Tax=Tautonia marina TaxID=2653855 RepID=UPI0012604822|nr:FKBP-type peptidyl-prolyl cis-trans isomerase [Tautonia marina]